MGTADAVPGISGGSIALITGVYQRLIKALSSPDLDLFEELLNKSKKSDLQALKDIFLKMDVPFLLVLGSGVITAILIVLNLIEGLLESDPIPVFSFFIGLILVSAVIIYREVELETYWSKFSAITGFLFALLVAGVGAGSLGHSPLILFFSGTLAISAMILPGISGSLILVMLGQYEYMSDIVSTATDTIIGVFTGEASSGLMESVIPASIFIFGAFTGIFSMVKVVKKALDRNREATMAFLVSLMLGSLRAPLTRIDQAINAQGVSWISIAPEFLLASAVGGALIYVLDFKTLNEKKSD